MAAVAQGKVCKTEDVEENMPSARQVTCNWLDVCRAERESVAIHLLLVLVVYPDKM